MIGGIFGIVAPKDSDNLVVSFEQKRLGWRMESRRPVVTVDPDVDSLLPDFTYPEGWSSTL